MPKDSTLFHKYHSSLRQTVDPDCQGSLCPDSCKLNLYIGVGRFRILGVGGGGGGQGLEFWGGARGEGQIPSRHMTS